MVSTPVSKMPNQHHANHLKFLKTEQHCNSSPNSPNCNASFDPNATADMPESLKAMLQMDPSQINPAQMPSLMKYLPTGLQGLQMPPFTAQQTQPPQQQEQHSRKLKLAANPSQLCAVEQKKSEISNSNSRSIDRDDDENPKSRTGIAPEKKRLTKEERTIRNRMSAQAHREQKRAEVDKLKAENTNLISKCEMLSTRVDEVENENQRLKAHVVSLNVQLGERNKAEAQCEVMRKEFQEKQKLYGHAASLKQERYRTKVESEAEALRESNRVLKNEVDALRKQVNENKVQHAQSHPGFSMDGQNTTASDDVQFSVVDDFGILDEQDKDVLMCLQEEEENNPGNLRDKNYNENSNITNNNNCDNNNSKSTNRNINNNYNTNNNNNNNNSNNNSNKDNNNDNMARNARRDSDDHLSVTSVSSPDSNNGSHSPDSQYHCNQVAMHSHLSESPFNSNSSRDSNPCNDFSDSEMPTDFDLYDNLHDADPHEDMLCTMLCDQSHMSRHMATNGIADGLSTDIKTTRMGDGVSTGIGITGIGDGLSTDTARTDMVDGDVAWPISSNFEVEEEEEDDGAQGQEVGAVIGMKRTRSVDSFDEISGDIIDFEFANVPGRRSDNNRASKTSRLSAMSALMFLTVAVLTISSTFETNTRLEITDSIHSTSRQLNAAEQPVGLLAHAGTFERGLVDKSQVDGNTAHTSVSKAERLQVVVDEARMLDHYNSRVTQMLESNQRPLSKGSGVLVMEPISSENNPATEKSQRSDRRRRLRAGSIGAGSNDAGSFVGSARRRLTAVPDADERSEEFDSSSSSVSSSSLAVFVKKQATQNYDDSTTAKRKHGDSEEENGLKMLHLALAHYVPIDVAKSLPKQSVSETLLAKGNGLMVRAKNWLTQPQHHTSSETSHPNSIPGSIEFTSLENETNTVAMRRHHTAVQAAIRSYLSHIYIDVDVESTTTMQQSDALVVCPEAYGILPPLEKPRNRSFGAGTADVVGKANERGYNQSQSSKPYLTLMVPTRTVAAYEWANVGTDSKTKFTAKRRNYQADTDESHHEDGNDDEDLGFVELGCRVEHARVLPPSRRRSAHNSGKNEDHSHNSSESVSDAPNFIML